MKYFYLYICLIFLKIIHANLNVKNCPNDCSNNGVCKRNCTCYPGYHGVDCSIRLCPSSIAWVDIPYLNNSAHSSFTECSNMGTCDRVSGNCKCNNGYTGAACERMLCPIGTTSKKSFLPCSGHGKCISVKEILDASSFISDKSTSNYSDWDSEKIYGCVCDEGWTGISCSKIECPKGDDPLTPGLNEIQLIDCVNINSVGSIVLSYGDQFTKPIPHDATSAYIENVLENLKGLEDISVFISSGSVLCSQGGSLTEVTFILPQKPKYRLVATIYEKFDGWVNLRANGEQSLINSTKISVGGTKEYIECSNRGICDKNSGLCNCLKNFYSSNGLGSSGKRGDCGHFELFTTISCPMLNNLPCGGISRGICEVSTGKCNCNSGYFGGDCSQVNCPRFDAWFGNNISTNTLLRFGLSECSGVADCNHNTGTCDSCGGNFGHYTGIGCEKLACMITGFNNRSLPSYCSSNGYCATLKEIAGLSSNKYGEKTNVIYSTPWDSDRIQGCVCFLKESVMNTNSVKYDQPEINFVQIDGSLGTLDSYPNIFTQENSKFYRGPMAYTYTDFIGVNCNQKKCPNGDNPLTDGVDEIQTIKCYATGGHFSLSFRNNVTMNIAASSNVRQLKYILEQVSTIQKVDVNLNGISTSVAPICNLNEKTGKFYF